MDWVDAVLGLLGVVSIAAFGFSIRLALCAKAKAAGVELALANFKTEVAERYVSVTYLKDVEGRLMMLLEKIEKKFDRLLIGGSEGR